MELEDIFLKKGSEWSEPERQFVTDWLDDSGELNRLIRITYAKLRDTRKRYGIIDDPYGEAITLVWLKIQDAFNYYDPTTPRAAPFPIYLGKCVYREISRVIGRYLRKRNPPPPGSTSPLPAPVPPAPPDLTATSNLDRDELEAKIEGLPPLYREALEFLLRGLSRRDAAAQSRFKLRNGEPCTEGAMKVRVWRALQELRRLLGGDGFFGEEDDQ